jgi:5-methylcytosine-specific restriction endonuclease McrA
MSNYLQADLRRRLLDVDDHCCAYCQTAQANSGQPMTIDHIVPTSQGGETDFENLCFACRRCNEFKGAVIRSQDPLTTELVWLYNPRLQSWDEHFAWDASGTHLIGLTPVGRVTILILQMNNEIILNARRRWVNAGWHPPS